MIKKIYMNTLHNIENVEKRFLKYVKVDTQSDASSQQFPSTDKQLTLLKILADELSEIGMSDVDMDKNGYVTATLPSNTNKKAPVIGFLAHVDTSPEMSGTGVNPKIIENYDGKPIVLNDEKNIVASPDVFTDLKKYIGQKLITTDGTTLLGADDKAGIAEIITAIQYLIEHPEIEHGTIKIGFTPDEEIGRGVDKFDVEKFNADFAYTLDGSGIGELEYENFNAAIANVIIMGQNVHPGAAKNKMVNSMHIATELNNMLPPEQRPEHTTNYEGFYHLLTIDGSVEKTTMEYIIRDHAHDNFLRKKEWFSEIATTLNKKYDGDFVRIEMKDQYYNMREKIEPVFHIIELAKDAMIRSAIKPKIQPIRGGTDGSRLSYMGLPCPNIFTGGHYFHSRYEFIPVLSMYKAVEVIVRIAKNAVHQNK